MPDLLTKGFEFPKSRNRHFQTHGEEFGAKNAEEYEAMADAFLGGLLTGYMKECSCTTCEDVLRYDKRSQAFGVVCEGYIVTFYRLDKGSNARNELYFDNECDARNCQGMRT